MSTPRTCPSCNRGQRLIQPMSGTQYDCGSLWLGPGELERTEMCIDEAGRLLKESLALSVEKMLAFTQSKSDFVPCEACKATGWKKSDKPLVEN